jgi:hypothetical protein
LDDFVEKHRIGRERFRDRGEFRLTGATAAGVG